MSQIICQNSLNCYQVKIGIKPATASGIQCEICKHAYMYSLCTSKWDNLEIFRVLYWCTCVFWHPWCITVTSYWVQWRLKSPGSWLFTQLFVQAKSKKTSKHHLRLHCLLKGLFRRRQKKHQSSASLAFVRGIHRLPVNSPHKRPVTRKMFPFNDVIIDVNECVCCRILRWKLPSPAAQSTIWGT